MFDEYLENIEYAPFQVSEREAHVLFHMLADVSRWSGGTGRAAKDLRSRLEAYLICAFYETCSVRN